MLDMMRTYLESYLAPYVKNEEGQGMVEYGLIIALIAVIVIAALTLTGGNLKLIFEAIAAKLGMPAQ